MNKLNVVLKVGIGLVLGIGALTFAPQTAHASSPCYPDQGPCSPPPNTKKIDVSTPFHLYDVCLPTKCGGTDTKLYAEYRTEYTFHYISYPTGIMTTANCYVYTFTAIGPC